MSKVMITIVRKGFSMDNFDGLFRPFVLVLALALSLAMALALPHTHCCVHARQNCMHQKSKQETSQLISMDNFDSHFLQKVLGKYAFFVFDE